VDWGSVYQHALEWIGIFIQQAAAWSASFLEWAVQWASETANSNLVRTIAALIGIPYALWGCYLFVRWLFGRGLDKTVDQIHSTVGKTHSLVERLQENKKQIPTPERAEEQALVSHKIEHTTEHVIGSHYLKHKDGRAEEIVPTPQLNALAERIIGVKRKK
jgi:hypothetical protein